MRVEAVISRIFLSFGLTFIGWIIVREIFAPIVFFFLKKSEFLRKQAILTILYQINLYTIDISFFSLQAKKFPSEYKNCVPILLGTGRY